MRARIKSIDTRGRVLGFVDNVFDQKRGKRTSLLAPNTSPQPDLSPRGVKRSRPYIDNDELEKTSRQHGGSITVASSGPRGTRGSETSDVCSTNMATPGRNNPGRALSQAFDPLGQFRSENQVEPRLPGIRQPSRSSESRSVHYAYLPPPGSIVATPDRSVSRCHTGRDDTRSDPPDEENIHDLENKLEALRGYADDLLELSLVESHAKILDRISQFEAEIEKRRRRKAELLLSRLSREFPDLADLVREEARRQGL